MSGEVILFLLRLVAGLILIVWLGVLFLVIVRDYRSTVTEVQASRRTYGQLKELRELDGEYVFTGQGHALLPLTSLGRSPTNTIRVDDTFASGEHALVALRNGQWWLEDRRSRNGTMLNGVMVSQSIVITDGDIIGIGAVRYKLELEH